MKVVVLFLFTGLVACASTPSPAPDAAAGEGCHSPLGFIPEGRSAKGYLRPVEQGGLTCQQGDLTCENGVWSGPYIYPSCTRLGY